MYTNLAQDAKQRWVAEFQTIVVNMHWAGKTLLPFSGRSPFASWPPVQWGKKRCPRHTLLNRIKKAKQDNEVSGAVNQGMFNGRPGHTFGRILGVRLADTFSKMPLAGRPWRSAGVHQCKLLRHGSTSCARFPAWRKTFSKAGAWNGNVLYLPPSVQ